MSLIKLFQVSIILLGFFPVGLWTPPDDLLAAEEPANLARTIVLDPGHGADDGGSSGTHGSREKDITLALARAIQSHLDQRYRIVLTHSDDRKLTLFDRTAIANHLRADLFISLHVGGSFLKTTRNAHVFYYLPPQAAGLLTEGNTSLPEASDPAARPWHAVQQEHTAESRRMAELMGGQMAGQAIFRQVQVSGAPLAVLQGADMPAVLIEAGYLTHPATENELQDPRHLDQYASAIGDAIAAAMEKSAR
jgi:N-acetylmuramoyl-L-alanine amidase